ncbi:MAG: hypothetical protein ABL894_08435 [Hyphomicrobium sp.]
MKKLSQTKTVVVIEWNGEGGSTIDHLREADLLNLARALGRLAARRELARLAATQPAEQVMISTLLSAKVKQPA